MFFMSSLHPFLLIHAVAWSSCPLLTGYPVGRSMLSMVVPESMRTGCAWLPSGWGYALALYLCKAPSTYTNPPPGGCRLSRVRGLGAGTVVRLATRLWFASHPFLSRRPAGRSPLMKYNECLWFRPFQCAPGSVETGVKRVSQDPSSLYDHIIPKEGYIYGHMENFVVCKS